MRTTLTFILRLLVDADDPQALRGVIRTVGGISCNRIARRWGDRLLYLPLMVR